MSSEAIRRLKPFVPVPVRRALNRAVRRPARRVSEGASRRIHEQVAREVGARIEPAGLHPISDILPSDVVVVGPMKSGNTWFRFLIAGAIFGVDVRAAPSRLVYLLAPDVELDRYYVRHGPTVFFKSHEFPKPEYRRVIYLLRDGRDVMVSLFHHMQSLRGPENVDFMDLASGARDPCRWDEHVEAWMANPHEAEMITIRYEDLVTDGVKELRRLCEFVGVEREDAVLESALSNTRLDQMRDIERRYGTIYHPRWDRNRRFFRRGEIGSYRDEMPPEVLAAFVDRAGPMLRKTGYLEG